jgi:hypothetical protein
MEIVSSEKEGVLIGQIDAKALDASNARAFKEAVTYPGRKTRS